MNLDKPIDIRSAFLQVANFEPSEDQILRFRAGTYGVKLQTSIQGNKLTTTQRHASDFLIQALERGVSGLPLPRMFT